MASTQKLLHRKDDIGTRSVQGSYNNSRINTPSVAEQLANPNLRRLQQIARQSQETKKPKSVRSQRNFKVPNFKSQENEELQEKPKNLNVVLPKINQQEDSQENSQAELCAKEDCPLEAEDIPPVGEVEHCVGYCYCHNCKCGQHICPGVALRTELSPSLMWTTSYRQNFRRSSVEAPNVSPYAYMQQVKSSFKPGFVEITTTHQKDFTPHTSSPKSRFFPRELKPSLKMCIGSSYSKDFPNWEVGQPVHMKEIHQPYRGNMVRTFNSTTYSEEFKQFSPEKLLKNKNLSTGRLSEKSHPISMSSKFFGETTSSLNFKNKFAEALNYNQKPEVRKHHYKNLTMPRSHYSSDYSSNFVPRKTFTVLPRGKKNN